MPINIAEVLLIILKNKFNINEIAIKINLISHEI